jgi:hypothetical protein
MTIYTYPADTYKKAGFLLRYGREGHQYRKSAASLYFDYGNGFVLTGLYPALDTNVPIGTEVNLSYYGNATSSIDYTTRVNTAKLEIFRFGSAEHATNVYRSSGSTRLPYNTAFSIKLCAYSNIRKDVPIRVHLFDTVEDISSTKTFTVEIAQPEGADELKIHQIWTELVYCLSGTTRGKWLTSRSAPHIVGTGTSLSSSSATWVGLTNPVRQKISITTTSTGRVGLCSMWINLDTPGKLVYVDPYPILT